MDFQINDEHKRLQTRSLELAADFATRSADHDAQATHPTENYDRLREEGFLELTVPKEWGGSGVDFLGHTLVYEALGQGCPATALAFNMHASMVGPVLESTEVSTDCKQRVAELVVQDKKLIAGNFSEAGTTALLGLRPMSVRARRVDGGYRISGRKMFASMLEAADYCVVGTYPETATSPTAATVVLVPRVAPGRSVDANWDTIGMRATRSDSLILEECWVPESAFLFQTDDITPFRQAHANWLWGSYTAVYLGVAVAAYEELRKVVSERQPQGYAQPLPYHPDVRHHVAKMSVRSRSSPPHHLPLRLAERQTRPHPGDHRRIVSG